MIAMMWLVITMGVVLVPVARHGSTLLAARLAPNTLDSCRRILEQRVDCFVWGVLIAVLAASPVATGETRNLAPFGGVVVGVIALIFPLGERATSPQVRNAALGSATRQLLLAVVAGVAGWLTGAALFGPL